jgi:hypothetical protein
MLNAVKLDDLELERVLSSFGGEQQPRVIKGIHDNPSILTHQVCGNFYTNNVPDIAQRANPILLKHGYKLACEPQAMANKLTKSHHWFFCHISEPEVLKVGEPANEGVFKCINPN